VVLTELNDQPTLTAMAAPVDTVAEHTQAQITFAEIAAQGDEADVDGTVTAFVVKAVSSGTLLIGTSSATATAFAAGTNDIIYATHQAYWTGAQDVNATLNAFTVVAKDDGGLESATPVQVQVDVTPVNDPPTLTTMAAPVDTVAEDTQVQITFAEIAAQGDEADADGIVTAFVVKAVSSGTLLIGTNAGTATAFAAGTNDTIDATHQAYWTGAHDANGTLNAFTVVAKDDGGLESALPAVQVQVSVTAVNDPPVVTAGNTINYTEQQTSPSAVPLDAALTVADDGGTLDSAAVEISSGFVAGDQLSFDQTFATAHGITGAYAAGTLTLSGTASTADYQTVLQSVAFASSSDNPDNFGADPSRTVSWTVNDGTQDNNVAATTTINVTAVNAAPETDLNGGGTGTENTASFTEQTPVLVAPSAKVTDVDSANLSSLTATLTTRPDGDGLESLSLDATTAGLAASHGLAVTYTEATGVLSITGSASVADYQSILEGVLYNNTGDTPTTADRNVNVVVNDGTVSSAAHSVTIGVTAVNDAPSGTDNTKTINEDTPYTFTVADFGFSDPVEGNNFAAVGIATLNNGALTNNGNPVNVGDFVSVADINSGKLVFTPGLNFNGTLAPAFEFVVQDDGGTDNSGIDTDETPNAFNFDITAVNDAPVNSVPPGPVTTNEDSPIQIGTFSVSDVDLGNNPITVTLSVQHGTIHVRDNLPGGVNATNITGNDTASVTLTGDLSVVNTTITDENNGAIIYTPAANHNGPDQLTMVSNDGGATGTGGAKTNTDVTDINIRPVNDAPSGTDNTKTINEDTPYTFTVADFGFSDPVEGNAFQAVKIGTISGGTLTDNGTTVNSGEFVPLADIGTGKLVFTPDANINGAMAASFAFQVQDDGGTANAGVDIDPSANGFTFNITAVNDAPAGTDKTVTGFENSAYTFVASDFGFTDPADSPANAFLSVEITTLPSTGTLKNNGVALTAGDFVLVSDINTNKLTFTPTSNTFGSNYTSFTFQVKDDGGTANGGADLDPSPNTITVNVDPVNLPPDGADKTVTTNEDTPYVFAAADFGFSDLDGGSLLAVKITTLPGAGTITDNGVPVNAGGFIAVAHITGGLLHFNPAADANGAGYASFTFQVQDNGGIANGGGDTDPIPNTMTVNVTAVNDVPVLSGLGDSPGYFENSAPVVLDSNNNASVNDAELDVSVNHYAGATLTLARNGGANPDDVFGSVGSLDLTDSNGIGENVSLDGGASFIGTASQPGDGSFSITFNANATAADIDSVMRQITYQNASDNPPASAQIDFTLSDGNGQPDGQAQGSGPTPGIGTGSITVAITQVDDPPQLVNVTPTAAYVIGGPGIVLSSALGLFDPDATAPSPITGIHSGTVQIASGFFAGDELFVNLATSGGHLVTPDAVTTNISASYAAGTLTLSGTDTVQDYQAVLDAVSYRSTQADPSNGGTDPNRTITWSVNDGVLNSQIPAPGVNETLLHFDAPPVVDLDTATPGTGFSTTFTENGAPLAIVAADSIIDPDNADLPSATITLTNAQAGDGLSIAGSLPGGISSSIDTSVPGQITLTLINPASLADYQTALAQIRFVNISENPSSTDRDISVVTTDGDASSNVAHAIIHVIPVNDAPVAQNGSASGNEDTVISGTVPTATDADNTAAQLTYSLVGTNGGTAHGTVAMTANGTFSYTPQANFNGTDSFKYKANDGAADSNAATITLTVSPVNDAPVAQNGSASGNEDTAISGTVSASDVDNTAAQLSYSLAGANGGAQHGTVTLNANGSFTYRPTANYNGSDSFSFRASDGALNSNIALESLTVFAVNDPPVFPNNQDNGFAPAGGPSLATISVLENTTAVTIVAATDIDSPTLAYSIVGGADAARFQINVATGALSFVAAPDFEKPSDTDHNNSYIVQVRASDGSLSADEIITVNVTDVKEVVTIARPVDFNADGMDDLLWRTADGGVSVWTYTGGLVSPLPTLTGSAPLSTTIEGTGDFNGDGTGDILFRSADGHIAEWLMNGTQITAARDVGTIDASWHVAGTGDFNGDHTDDILFRNDAGQVVTWSMQGGNIAAIKTAGSVGPTSHIQGTGDFNGDGRTDILFRNDDGHVVTWLMSNGQASAIVDIGSTPASAHIAGTGDFNGDGQTDILFRGDDGHVTEWLMTSGHIASIQDIGSANASWNILGTGDVNGDGREDIVWGNGDGHVTVAWLLNNAGQLASAQDIGHTPTGAQIAGSHFDLV
jgi:VCBS repeat-containing protein